MIKSNKLTLLIDGNWLLMSRLAVIANKYIDETELCNNLQLLMIQSIKLVLKQFPKIDNVIFCSDGGSWRNSIEIPDFVRDENGNLITYKGNREKSEDINWDLIFESYEHLISILKQNNINVYKESGIEGDDLIWWWSKKLNSEDINCIIWSKDNDLKQLVNIDSNKCFTVWWNKASGMFVSEFDDNDLDFLFNNSYNENDVIFKSITNNIPVTKFNKNAIIVDKIIRGDKSDNIEPILYRNSKSTKKYIVSSADIDYLLKWKNDQEVYDFLSNLLKQKKYQNPKKTLDEVYKHFLYNRQLVALDSSSYPKEIIEKLKSLEIKENTSIDNIYIVENYLRSNINQLNGILNII